MADYITTFQVQATSPNGVVATKMFWFDLEPLIRADLADRALIAPDQVTLCIQRDGVSDAWRERFMAEARVADPAIWAFCQTLDVATSARHQT